MSESETLAIIGTGNVGAALGIRLAGAGHPIRFGARPGKDHGELLDRVTSVGGRAVVASPAEAAAAAPIVFLAVPAAAAIEAARELALAPGKILIDCTNPVRWDGGPVWAPPAAGSTSAALAEALPGVRVIKAFNGFGAEFHADPKLGETAVDVFMAGDDMPGKIQLALLIRKAGFSPVDAGPLRNASLLENLAVLWIHLATVGGRGRNAAFKLLERSPRALP
ncbi:NADPH-dependent F420 reductase [Nannocystaceae bacterium ST9]